MNLATRSLLLLASATSWLAAMQSPSCLSGRASTAVEGNTWVEPHPSEVVGKQVVKSIRTLGYTFTDTTGPLVTAPKFSWPSSSAFTLWRDLAYPGAKLIIAMEPVGPWTRVRLETRLVCETDQRPPPGHPQDVDFQTFVLHQTNSEAWSAIIRPLHQIKVRVFAESCAPLDDGDLKIDVCRRMAEAQPRNPEALRQYVLALARFYRAHDAWKPLGKLFALEGERASTYTEVGNAMLEARDFDDARKLFARATELWPTDAIMAYHLGRAQLGLHRLGPAIDAFAVAIRLDSSLTDGHTYAAVAAAGLGRSDESLQHCSTARRALEAGLANRVADIDTWLGLAFCASISARHREAVSYFARAITISDSRARETPELVDQIMASHALVGDQPPAPLPRRQ